MLDTGLPAGVSFALGVLAGLTVLVLTAIGLHRLGKLVHSQICRPIWARVTRAKDRLAHFKRLLGTVYDGLAVRVPHAISYTVFVLGVSVLAPALFVALDGLVIGLEPGWLRTRAAAVLVACVAGFATALFVSTLRGPRVRLSEAVLRELAGKASPDCGFAYNFVPLVPRDPRWLDGTISRYDNLYVGSEKAEEWVITLHQAGGEYQGLHSIACLRQQIGVLETLQKKAQRKRSVCASGPCTNPALRWVCFVSRAGRFHALQSWEVFRWQIMDKGNAAYPELLNIVDEDKFASEIARHMVQSSAQKSGLPQFYSDAIADLSCYWIVQGTSRKDALRIMTNDDKARAMLVTQAPEGAPVGVVSVKKLAQAILFKPLEDCRLDGPPPPPESPGKEPPFLPKPDA